MKEHIVLHKDQIKDLVWNFDTLNQSQKELLRDKLLSFAGEPLYRKELIKMLRELRDGGQISKIDYESLSETLLKLFEQGS